MVCCLCYGVVGSDHVRVVVLGDDFDILECGCDAFVVVVNGEGEI